jgi:hypothetical protein
VDFVRQRKKEILLGALLVAIGVVVWQQLGGEEDGLGGPGRGAGGRTDITALKVFPVDWAALTATRPAYDPSGRNLFNYGVIPPPPPRVPTPEEAAAIARAQKEAQEAREKALADQAEQQKRLAELVQQQAIERANAPPPPPPKPQPPAINYKFIGYIGPPDRKLAVLHDGADLVFARQGDVLGKNFRILEIGYESIKFGYTDAQFKGEYQTLPMSSSN